MEALRSSSSFTAYVCLLCIFNLMKRRIVVSRKPTNVAPNPITQKALMAYPRARFEYRICRASARVKPRKARRRLR